MSTRTKAFVVILNADNTEGRGPLYPGAVCELRETAERIAKGKGFQGSDADVRETELRYHGGYTFGPIHIQKPIEADLELHSRRRAADVLEQKRKLILEKAIELGLTEEEIALLKD